MAVRFVVGVALNDGFAWLYWLGALLHWLWWLLVLRSNCYAHFCPSYVCWGNGLLYAIHCGLEGCCLFGLQRSKGGRTGGINKGLFYALERSHDDVR